tara:strand:+ start:479 stop:1294 length:816 start_codon:yes stop_codon:yes gene_type:complete
MKTLIAGPWVGEFGWELFGWNAYVRVLSRQFDKTIVISRANSQELYSDFADEYIPYEPEGGLSDAFFMHNLDINQAFKKVVTTNKISLTPDTTVFVPRRIGFPPHTHYTQHVLLGEHLVQPEYICFGQESDTPYDYVFHIRDRELRKEDNWSLDNWRNLKELLGNKRIACIGTPTESACIEGTDDLRGHNLKEVFTVLRNAQCAFGPSSGPMHLASLCGTPHIVWSKDANKERYEENWNPLSTKVLFTSEHSWQPSPEFIYNKFVTWSTTE